MSVAAFADDPVSLRSLDQILAEIARLPRKPDRNIDWQQLDGVGGRGPEGGGGFGSVRASKPRMKSPPE